MPLDTAQSLAWSLAQSLMVPMILIEAGDDYAVLPSAEFDGDADTVVREYDPFAR